MMLSVFWGTSVWPICLALLTTRSEIDAAPWIMAGVVMVVMVIYNLSEVRD